jgi:hypothetical protein
MTCDACAKIQDIAFDKNIVETIPIAYVRIEEANVAIVGCEKHLQILINKLRKEKKK